MADCSELRMQLKGELNVQRSVELKGELEEALAQSDHLLLDFDEASGFDLSFLQLLCAVQRSAQTMKKRVSLDGIRPKALQGLLASVGLQPHDSCFETCSCDCLWGESAGHFK